MTRQISVGGVKIGGGAPVSVQSMTNVPTHDRDAVIAQIQRLEAAGCEIARLAVPDMRAVEALRDIKAAVRLPLVADIHFDYRLALGAVEAGVDKIRINPGNIGGDERVREVAWACRDRGVPIRIGVNGGSLEKHLLESFGGPTPEAMVQSAFYHLELLEKYGFYDSCVSLKASSVKNTFEAYRQFSEKSDYPLHLGVTETGSPYMGVVKSSMGIGALLLLGIGDTLRVSLTDTPEEEVKAGLSILRAAGLRRDRPEIISCPTCGRTKIDLIALEREVEERLKDVSKPITVAVMGCAVNGPGEASHADAGIAGGDGMGVVFKHGVKVASVPQERLVDALMDIIKEL